MCFVTFAPPFPLICPCLPSTAEASGLSWQPGAQDADQSLRAPDARRNCEQHQGNVDRRAAVPAVLLPLAVHPHAGLVCHQHFGQKKGAEFQSGCGKSSKG